MPQLLRSHSVQLFEASLEALHLALLGLGVPRTRTLRVPSAAMAPVVGLLGAAAELAMSACLVQAGGSKSLMRSQRQYLSGPEILTAFLVMLDSGSPKSGFLIRDVASPDIHLDTIKLSSKKFRILFTARDGGLHGGMGPSRDVCTMMANDVTDFLDNLSNSGRIQPYLQLIPKPPNPPQERTLIVDQLAQSLLTANGTRERADRLTEMLLVLPQIPEEEPD